MHSHFTHYGWLVCAFLLLVPLQYGYHISALNQIKDVLTCRDTGSGQDAPHLLPPCIPMNDAVFSFVTSIFTIGGLAGSLTANTVMDRWGRRGAVRISSASIAAGSALMAVSSFVFALSIGRFLVGVGVGLGICVSPIFLSEIAPAKITSSVGVLTQLGVVLGIMITQIVGLKYAQPSHWRFVPFYSGFLALAQLFVSPWIVESPVWLKRKRLEPEALSAAKQLWADNSAEREGDVEAPLLREAEDRDRDQREPTASTITILTNAELRRPLMIVCLSMMIQQFSGINAVLYYSNDIFKKSFPEQGPYVSIGITVFNVIMTFPPIVLIERWGLKKLLFISITGAVLCHLAVAYGLNMGNIVLSSVALIAFVMSFAIGLGPVPFVLIPEVSPQHAVSGLSSIALSLNWVVNFMVGLSFLPLRNFLSSGDPFKEGRVFLVFAFLLFALSFWLARIFR